MLLSKVGKLVNGLGPATLGYHIFSLVFKDKKWNMRLKSDMISPYKIVYDNSSDFYPQ